SADVRVGRELLEATKPFVEESSAKSWWYVGSTFVLMISALAIAGMLVWWPLKLVFAILGALLIVRSFITFHDYLHGAILKESRFAYLLFHSFGALTLTPTTS
ncbi:fatty acid desaturase, partial [Marinobacter sp. SS21]|nr:fatty acid desaturase [Marinobacter sp. SS21]